ncbi:MAG TPA: hypothetical protein PK079_14520 [Leptospiraceae bacterium]|nr:hypothetical protein [Leptospiraceae bacterium]HMW07721.1 hypothetical protein [Leptospiraceae bacterium]HMX32009.1 hypothetical protein [Leptospiraceae bacterium]HMY33387.1 hypothetical protein [Leptospiraceae bacterium]HMZ64805.1 hypothetical protein [Leptospiraceae bacterium]
MKKIFFFIFAISLQLLSEPLKVGDEMTLLQFETQKEEKIIISKETRTLIFTSDMEASKIAHELFEKLGDDYLKQNNAIFISDIHKMPFLITKFVALPKMRKYPYSIALIREEGPGFIFPREKGRLTVISLSEYKVSSIQFVENTEDLKNKIDRK